VGQARLPTLSTTMAQIGLPQRKNKQMLTLIPEQERSIDWRFEFTIVGEGARQFSEMAVRSEMAEAFRPTAKHEEQAKEKLEHIGEDEEADRGIPKEKLRSVATDGDPHAKEKETLVLFCPIGENGKALARIRFTCVEQFSDSLPLGKDRQAALTQAFIFLFQPSSSRIASDKSPVDEFKSDFISRFAEINHTQEHFRPHCRILAIEAEPDLVELVEDIGKAKNVTTDSVPDSGEETIMESLQEVCEHLIKRHSDRGSGSTAGLGSPKVGGDTAPAPTGKSRACVML